MEIEEFGIRVDSVHLLKEIMSGSYVPKNTADAAVYSKMIMWEKYFGNPQVDYVYYGCEFCKKRFPSVTEWRNMASFCEDNHMILVMVIPAVDNETEKAALDIIYELNNRLKRIEVVINDFGMLERLNKIDTLNNIKVRLGRLLDKSYHDGRLNDEKLMKIFNDSQIKWTEDEDLISLMTQRVLKRYHTAGIDIDIPTMTFKHHFPQKTPDFSMGMFVPYSYTTTGGICLMQNIGIPLKNKFSSLNAECSRSCTKYCETLKKNYDDKEIVMYRIGNTIFYIRQCNIDLTMNTICINRVIFEPKLMI